MMKARGRVLGARRAVVVLACLWAVAASGAALASCEKKHRVSHRDAKCLEAEWKNEFAHVHFKARNHCSQTIAVKWDMRSASDQLWQLHPGGWRKGQSEFTRMRWAWCCRDLGICSPEDLVTGEACTKQWARSKPARDHLCTVEKIAKEGGRCRIKSRCSPTAWNSRHVVANSLVVPVDKVRGLRLCAGRLSVEECSRRSAPRRGSP